MKCEAPRYGLGTCNADLTPERIRNEMRLCRFCDELRFFWTATQRLSLEWMQSAFKTGQAAKQCPVCHIGTLDVHKLKGGNMVSLCPACRSIVVEPQRGEACRVL